MLVRGVIFQQAPEAPSGWSLALAVGWYGLLYGCADAILLNVIPVAAVRGDVGRPRSAFFAFLASLLITAIYHLGFIPSMSSSSDAFHGPLGPAAALCEGSDLVSNKELE